MSAIRRTLEARLASPSSEAAPRERLERLLATGRVQWGNAVPCRAPVEPWSLAALAGRIVEVGPPGAWRDGVRRDGAQRDGLRPAVSARSTMLARLVAEAHAQREPVAWIGGVESSVYPPDLISHGVDLASLVFVRLRADGERLRAADTLVRSGGFGLVIVELGGGAAGSARRARSVARRSVHGPRGANFRSDAIDPAQWVRLAGLAKHHDCALCCVPTTSGGGASGASGWSGLGSAVSLRVIAERRRQDGVEGDVVAEGGRFAACVRVVKDKRSRSVERASGFGEQANVGGRWAAVQQVFRGPLGVR